MFQVFYHDNSIIILNDDNNKNMMLLPGQEKTLFEENPLLKDLQQNKTKRIFLENIYGLKKLP